MGFFSPEWPQGVNTLRLGLIDLYIFFLLLDVIENESKKCILLDPDLDQKIARRESWEYLLILREPEQRNDGAQSWSLLEQLQVIIKIP
jgi:hypothetical protein